LALIAEWPDVGRNANGWVKNTDLGVYGANSLKRAEREPGRGKRSELATENQPFSLTRGCTRCVELQSTAVGVCRLS
jgi:hypothetical protein